MRRYALLLLVAVAGCKYLDQPKKVAELEKRLDEVSDVLSDMAGKPVGARPKAKHDDGDDEDGDSGKGKKAKAKGKEAKADKGKADKGKADKAKGRHGDDEEGDDGEEGDDEAKADPPRTRGDWRKRDDVDAGKDGEQAEASHDEPTAAPPEVPKAPAANVHWGYEPDDGPATWSKLDPAFATCAAGHEQSPIDILPRHSDAPEVIFVYKPSAATVVDNGHTLEVDVEPGSFIVVDGTRYDLVQFHVHTPSEHTIAGDSFPMEVHLVHKSKAGKLAVVAVLFAEGEASTALAAVWKGEPKAKGSAPLKKPFDPDALLPKDRSAYRYDGSLTTPPCTEGVIWHVLKRTRTEDEARITEFTHRFGANARPVQELGERELR